MNIVLRLIAQAMENTIVMMNERRNQRTIEIKKSIVEDAPSPLYALATSLHKRKTTIGIMYFIEDFIFEN